MLADVNLESVEKAKKIIASKHPIAKTFVVKTDVGVENNIKSLVAVTIKLFGRLDIMAS